MSSSDVVAQSAFDVLRLGRSSQFIVARLLRYRTPKTSRRVLWQDPQEFAIQYRESELVTGEDDAYRIALQSPAGAARGQLVQL
ncbi:hypothetical protein DY000_02001389 [Brassica cretica]|uniref:Uncharacterized protein n=1 Tax=Brassica cretica TaxID=69181 RepID=A0ABQ7C840_BRACR|nr:hypothetical protein DY000_02001389 [Brassica cretica]